MKVAFGGKHFHSISEVMRAVEDYCSDQDPSFYEVGKHVLQYRWEKHIQQNCDNVEK